ncbi:acetyltransferase, GNAT family [Roseibacterium elongatum DSM 19469]|uniref:Acetyltransferase, GNAT family n=1 Tax=Roseicyclus elongatus DSM 19469 TaxID=1294273 RepID=W8S0T5_9RHOB|nr:GNAT family N-acetyltransferase [Roseibacterium elongatum]AHM03772.1 acetyltransferase, GNAT family [Roseibacterium elongatum DSM 19469]
MTQLHVRPAHDLDAREMAAILNDVIAIGGTTAMTGRIDASYFVDRMRAERDAASWLVAETPDGEIVGFQWITRGGAYLPPEAAEIATFAKPGWQGVGIGSRLMEATKAAARTLGYAWINANIRADNASGLTYYQSCGFEDWGRQKGVRLGDGQIVDKVLKRYDLV